MSSAKINFLETLKPNYDLISVVEKCVDENVI